MGRDTGRSKQSAKRNYVAMLIVCTLVLLNAAAVAGQQNPTLVSINSAGTGSGDYESGDWRAYRITPDGRYVVFESDATNLVPVVGESRDSNIYVRDLQTGRTTMASVNRTGTRSTSGSSFGLISDNGRYVAFASFASDIANIPINSSPNVYLRDLQTGTTRLVSINGAGTAGGAGGPSRLLAMTPDGRFITFWSFAKDLTSHPDGAFGADIFVRDMVNNVTTLVTVNAAGTASGNGNSYGSSDWGGSTSDDGRYVVFSSEASDLVSSDTSTLDVFMRDLQEGKTIRLSTNAAGTAAGNNASMGPVIDRSGRFVVFMTLATDLSTIPDKNSLGDIFIYDLKTGTRRLITVNVAGTETGFGYPDSYNDSHYVNTPRFSISDNGRFVAFSSQLGNLVPTDSVLYNNDIFLYEVATQSTTLVSVNFAGETGPEGSSNPSISADGRIVAFDSWVTTLASEQNEPPRTAGFDVFVRDVVAGKTHPASINSAGTMTGNLISQEAFISADGTRVVFVSSSTDLVTNDTNGTTRDVFVFTIQNDEPPVLVTEENTDLAVALDSVTQTRDLFSVLNPFNFSSDQRTRISLFVRDLSLLPGEGASAITVEAEDEQGRRYPMPVEYVGTTPDFAWTRQVVVKLPDEMGGGGDYWLRITYHGRTSNRAQIRIKVH